MSDALHRHDMLVVFLSEAINKVRREPLQFTLREQHLALVLTNVLVEVDLKFLRGCEATTKRRD